MLIITIFPSLSRRRPLHRREHDDGFQVHNRRVSKWYGVGDSRLVEKPCEKPRRCSRTCNQDSPSGNNGRLPSGNSHQRPCYVPLMANLQLVAQSVSKLSGILGLPPYLCESDHAPVCSNSCNSLALAGSGSRRNPRSRHFSR